MSKKELKGDIIPYAPLRYLPIRVSTPFFIRWSARNTVIRIPKCPIRSIFLRSRTEASSAEYFNSIRRQSYSLPAFFVRVQNIGTLNSIDFLREI